MKQNFRRPINGKVFYETAAWPTVPTVTVFARKKRTTSTWRNEHETAAQQKA